MIRQYQFLYSSYNIVKYFFVLDKWRSYIKLIHIELKIKNSINFLIIYFNALIFRNLFACDCFYNLQRSLQIQNNGQFMSLLCFCKNVLI